MLSFEDKSGPVWDQCLSMSLEMVKKYRYYQELRCQGLTWGARGINAKGQSLIILTEYFTLQDRKNYKVAFFGNLL